MRFVVKIAVVVIVICALVVGGFYALSRYNASTFAKEELERAEKAGLLKKVGTEYTLAQGTVKIDAVIADATDFTVLYSLKSWEGINPNLTLTDNAGREYKSRGTVTGNKVGLIRFEPVKQDAQTAVIRLISADGKNFDTPVSMDFAAPYQKAKLFKEGETKDLGNAILTIDRIVLGATKTLVEVTVTGKGGQAESGNYFLQTDYGLKNNQPLSPVILVNGNQLQNLGGDSVTSGGNTMKGYFSFAPVEGSISEVKLSINNIPIAQEVDLGIDIFAKDTATLNKKIPNSEGYFYLKKVFNTPTDNQTHIYYDTEGATYGENIIASQFYDGQKAIYQGKHVEIESTRSGEYLIVFQSLPREEGKFKFFVALPHPPITFTYQV